MMSFEQLRNSTVCESCSMEESEEIVAFTTTIYIKRYWRQMLEKRWSVWESHTMFKIGILWLWIKKQERSLDIYH